MQITLSRTGEKVELHVNTISLVPTDSVSLFRCVVCGSAISQYEGAVTKIYPFLEPSDLVLIINKCPGCGTLYTFQSQQGRKKTTKVVLFKNPNFLADSTFRCYLCRTELLHYGYDHIFDLVHLRETSLPFTLKCPTFSCPANYNFIDVV